MAGVKTIAGVSLVVFRGSITLEDWYDDIARALPMDDALLGPVHSGFWQPVSVLALTLDQLLLGVSEVVICGHSLGAARALLYAASRKAQDLPVARVVTFGTPRPGFQRVASLLKETSVTAYKNRSDPVTDVPFTLPELPYVSAVTQTPLDIAPPLWDEIELLADHHFSLYLCGVQKLAASP